MISETPIRNNPDAPGQCFRNFPKRCPEYSLGSPGPGSYEPRESQSAARKSGRFVPTNDLATLSQYKRFWYFSWRALEAKTITFGGFLHLDHRILAHKNLALTKSGKNYLSLSANSGGGLNAFPDDVTFQSEVS